MVTDYSIRLYLRIVILLVIPLSTECTCSLITSPLSVTLPEVLPFFLYPDDITLFVTIYSVTLQAKKNPALKQTVTKLNPKPNKN